MLEEEDEDLKALVSAQKRRMWILRAMFASVIFGFFGMCGWSVSAPYRHHRARLMTPDEEARLIVAIDRAEARLNEQESQWLAASKLELVEGLSPGEIDCPLELRGAESSARDSYVNSGSVDVNYFGNVSFSRVERGEPLGGCDSCEWRRSQLNEVRLKLASHEVERREFDWVDDQRFGIKGTRIFLFEEEVTKPMVMSGTFEAGRVQGLAIIYSFDHGRWMCAAEVDARSSTNVKTSYQHQGFNMEVRARGALYAALARDLDVQIERNIAQNAMALAR